MNLGLGMLEVGLLDSGTSRVMEVAEAACTLWRNRILIVDKCILPWHTLIILVLIYN